MTGRNGRGVDMIEHLLLTFSRMWRRDEYQVFNGVRCCMWVPFGHRDLLVNEVEIQRRDKSHDKPPLLSPPSMEESP